MVNNLCPKCDGRGFHWNRKGVAYRHGPKCLSCNGTGQADHSLEIMAVLALMLVALFVIALVAFSLTHGVDRPR